MKRRVVYLIGLFFLIALVLPIFILQIKGGKCKGSDIVPCVQSKVEGLIKEGEIEQSLALLDEYYTKEVSLDYNTCHDLAHQIGREAYRLLNQNQDFRISGNTAICDFGFFHGFGETWQGEDGNLEEAVAFCEAADRVSSLSGLNCYHGLGHGVAVIHDPSLYGQEKEVIKIGTNLCKAVSPNPKYLGDCLIGLFNGISMDKTFRLYGMTEARENPFAVCQEYELENRIFCFEGMVPHLWYLAGYNLEPALSRIKTLGIEEQKAVLGQIAPLFVKVIEDDQGLIEESKACQSLPG